jgi:peptidoglycan-associated lipoprotein
MMTRSSLIAIGAFAFAAACGGKKPPEQPAPEPKPAEAPAPAPAAPAPAPAPANDDAANAARMAAERTKALTADLTAMIHFDYDKSDIMPDDKANLDRKAAILAANPSARIQIAGNCDERGSTEYNLALGNRRALAAKQYLVGKGVDGSRIETVSYGSERPLAQGSTEAAWAQNRNDQFLVTAGGSNLVSPS